MNTSTAASRIVSRIILLTLTLGVAGWAGAQEATSATDGYEGGRGLITLEGPTGLFINPTSGTLPENAYTVQYCVFFPENKTDVVGHGAFAGYGVTDDLEVGATGTYLDIDKASSLSGGGPFARYRMTKQDGNMPQTSVGAYSRFGDDALEKVGLFLAGYKRIPLSDECPVESIGLHAGVRHLWLDDKSNADDTSLAGYAGAELQFPLRIYAVGEITTKDSDLNKDVPYAFGLQWRAAGIAMSIAGIQNGNTEDVSFYYGIGFAHSL